MRKAKDPQRSLPLDGEGCETKTKTKKQGRAYPFLQRVRHGGGTPPPRFLTNQSSKSSITLQKTVHPIFYLLLWYDFRSRVEHFCWPYFIRLSLARELLAAVSLEDLAEELSTAHRTFSHVTYILLTPATLTGHTTARRSDLKCPLCGDQPKTPQAYANHYKACSKRTAWTGTLLVKLGLQSCPRFQRVVLLGETSEGAQAQAPAQASPTRRLPPGCHAHPAGRPERRPTAASAGAQHCPRSAWHCGRAGLSVPPVRPTRRGPAIRGDHRDLHHQACSSRHQDHTAWLLRHPRSPRHGFDRNRFLGQRRHVQLRSVGRRLQGVVQGGVQQFSGLRYVGRPRTGIIPFALMLTLCRVVGRVVRGGWAREQAWGRQDAHGTQR